MSGARTRNAAITLRCARAWVVALFGALVALLGVLVLLLWPVASLPAASPSTDSRTPSTLTARLRAATQPAPPVTEPKAPAAAPVEPPTPTPTAPIIEQRRVQRGTPTPPVGPADPEVQPATAPPDEWNRTPAARQRGVEQFGGTRFTESAVEAGLDWLARHQSPDGTWNRFDFPKQSPPNDRSIGVAVDRTNVSLTPGVTGLALLAFLGAGYTPETPPYGQTVTQAVAALLKMQASHGGFGHDAAMAGYNDALATLALAEYYAMTHDAQVHTPLERAVARIVSSQQALGGWDYVPRPESGRNDTSITAWMVQALHACAAAGVDVPRDTLVRAALHFTRATAPDGLVWYADTGVGFKLDDNFHPVYRFGPAMVAAGLMSSQMLGWRLDGAVPLRQAARLRAEPPSAELAQGRDSTGLHSTYYWYYGTLAMFQRGGADWTEWNGRLRDAILPLQNREQTRSGVKRTDYGSWRPFGPNWGTWGRMGGRVYSTAICTLTLEIYYRHTPAFLRDDLPYDARDWRAALANAEPREAQLIVAALAQMRLELAEPILVELASDATSPHALAAALALTTLDSPVGIPVLEAASADSLPQQRLEIERALARARAVAALPAATGRVRVFDAASGLATLELSWSYVGMRVAVQRDGAPVATMRVIQRFTGRNVVIAEQVAAAGEQTPRSGDAVSGH